MRWHSYSGGLGTFYSYMAVGVSPVGLHLKVWFSLLRIRNVIDHTIFSGVYGST